MKLGFAVLALVGCLTCASIVTAQQEAPLPVKLSSEKVALGKLLFNDTRLSEPAGQSCARCHSPANAFADPGGAIVSAGANGKFGNRNSPSVTYAMFTPAFGFREYAGKWAGGQFWDGRVDTLAEQALKPFLNPLEMNNTEQQLLNKIRKGGYETAIKQLYGEAVWQSDAELLKAVSDALQAFQSSDEIPRFTSKWDYFKAEKVELTEQERFGNFIFADKGKCMNCHATFNPDGPNVFTDFTYHNIGTPRNLQSPFLHVDREVNPAGTAYVDEGLAFNPKVPADQRASVRGKFRTPSLRNVALTAPYMHNGVFKTLREVVEFYNTRDVSDQWGEPEVRENVDTRDSGNLKLTEEEIDAVVAFLHTLTDGFQLPEEDTQLKVNQ